MFIMWNLELRTYSYGIFFVTFDTMDRLEIENPGQRFN